MLYMHPYHLCTAPEILSSFCSSSHSSSEIKISLVPCVDVEHKSSLKIRFSSSSWASKSDISSTSVCILNPAFRKLFCIVVSVTFENHDFLTMNRDSNRLIFGATRPTFKAWTFRFSTSVLYWFLKLAIIPISRGWHFDVTFGGKYCTWTFCNSTFLLWAEQLSMNKITFRFLIPIVRSNFLRSFSKTSEVIQAEGVL